MSKITKIIKIAKIIPCPTMPCNGYYGAMNGKDNPWLMMNQDYCDDTEPFDMHDYDVKVPNLKDKIDMLAKYEKNNLNEWENHFNHYLFLAPNFETPRPVMIGCNPYFSGGLYRNNGLLEFETDKEVVSDFDCKHYKFDARLVRKPTDAEYFEYFKDHYEAFRYRIKSYEPNKTTPKGSKYAKKDRTAECVVIFNKNKK